MEFKAHINIEIGEKIYSHKLFESLEILSSLNSQRKTAKELNISHSVLNRRIKNAEKNLGFKLIQIKGSKSYLTKEAIELLKIYNNYNNRVIDEDKIIIVGEPNITTLLNSISDYFPHAVNIYSSDELSAYDLAKKGFIDILALDDPKLAFKNNLEFTALAYDHLVLISNDMFKNKINSIEDLNGLNFVSIPNTIQRLAWNSLNKKNISFNITKEAKSEFDAFKIVKNSDDLHTFLSASYFKGNDILKNETNHAISLINLSTNKKVENFIEYLLNQGQKLIHNQGFTPIKPWKVIK